MVKTEIINQIQKQIQYLEQEKQKIEVELEAAKNYLNILKGNYSVANDINETKGNQTSEAREKMRKAQQERQERERRLRIQTIKDFLSGRNSATTQEIADYIHLKPNATKRYLRSNPDIKEIEINLWTYDPCPF